MYKSGFAKDIEQMFAILRNGGLKLVGADFFMHDFDDFCTECYPTETLLTFELAEKWIHNSTSTSQYHLSRRVMAMVRLGRYQCSLGKQAYIPNYRIKCPKAEEPRLFDDEQLKEFFQKVDTELRNTPAYPYKTNVFPVLFRMTYSCGLRSSEACNLKVEDIDLVNGKIKIYNSKGFKDRELPINDELLGLCVRFHKFYSDIFPERTYFFARSIDKELYTSSNVTKFFDEALAKCSFYSHPGKKFTPHGLRHLFAVHNIRKCAQEGEDFYNWLQYLYKYMGHRHINYTLYYLHITSQLFPIYSTKLRELEERIGVVYVEE